MRASGTKAIRNPWLDIPLGDYEGHMTLPEVAQTQLLSDVLAVALDELRPRSVAILGCAGGNGFDRVRPEVTSRVVGLDINPDSIREAARRFGVRMAGLELFVGDVQTDAFTFAPVDLVYSALLFGYLDVDVVLARVRSVLADGGRLLSVVQLPSDTVPEVTPSPFTRLGALASLMRLVPPERLCKAATAHRLVQTAAHTVASAGGKLLRIQTFIRM